MQVINLIKKFEQYEMTGENPLTMKEAQFLCENEDHDAFFFDYTTYRNIMDFRDHLELEA